MVLAMSSGVAIFFSGMVAVVFRRAFSSLRYGVAMGVSVHPGQTQLTRPRGASLTISFLSVGVSP